MYSSDFSASSLKYYIPLDKDQNSFYKIRSLAFVAYTTNKAFTQVNRKQMNILETFLEYLDFDIVAY